MEDCNGSPGPWECQERRHEAEKTLQHTIEMQGVFASEFSETPVLPGRPCRFSLDLGLLLHQTGRDAEQEESLRQWIRFANDIIAAEPTLIYHPVIIAKALMALRRPSQRGKGRCSDRLPKSCFWMRISPYSKPV